MTTMPCRPVFLAAAVALTAPLPVFAAGEPGTVGVAATTNATPATPHVMGLPPQGDRRIIEIGVNVLANERITTTSTGQAQFLLNDGTSFSVGPDSEVVLDKYVYDPERGTGEMAMSVSKGVMRFVGGKISKAQPVEIKIGSATMGIRGGIATVSAQPGQPVTARFLFGLAMSMTQNGVTQTTTRSGTAIDVMPGQPPSPPRPVTAQELRQTMSQMESSGGGGPGGASGGQIEGQMASSGVSNANSAGGPSIITTSTMSGNSSSSGPPSTPNTDKNTAEATRPPTTAQSPTQRFADMRGRVVVAGGGAAPYNPTTAGEDADFTAVINRSATHGISGLTTTTTGGTTTFTLNAAGNGGSLNTTLPIQTGTLNVGGGSFFALTNNTPLTGQIESAPQLGIGLRGFGYDDYYADNLSFFGNTVPVSDPLFAQPFNRIDTVRPGTGLGTTYSMRFLGYFRPTVSGVYTFATTSDDSSFLWLGNEGESIAALEARRAIAGPNQPLVANGGVHTVETETGTTGYLNAGSLYPILVYYGQDQATDEITVSFAGPGGTLGTDGRGVFFGPDNGTPTQTITLNGTTLAGVAYRADNPADFLFYSVFGLRPGATTPDDLVLMTYYSGTPTARTAFPTAGFGTHAAFGNFGLLSVPFTGQTIATNFTAGPSLLMSRYNSNITPADFPTNNARSVFLQSTLGIVGSGAMQQSVFAGVAGIYLADGLGGMTAAGNMRGTARIEDVERPLVFGSHVAAAETDGGGSAVYGATGNYMVFSSDRLELDATATPIRTTGAVAYDGFGGGAETSDFVLTGATAVTPGAGVTAPTRTTRILTGYAGGLMEERLAGGTLSPADGEIRGALGGVLVTTNATTNRAAAAFGFSVNATGYQAGFGSLTGMQANGAFINDNLFAATETEGSGIIGTQPAQTYGVMISHAVAPMPAAAFAPVGVDYCTCDFMQWGWWSVAMEASTGTNNRAHLATWVAGVLPNVVDIPLTGTATYGGHAIGNVNNNGSRYVAMGSYTQNWNFGTRTGSATIGNFDGRTISFATASPSANGRDFAMGLASATGGITAAGLEGSIYRSATDPTAGVGGRFGITGTGNYQASGTFVAGKTGSAP